MKKLFYAFCALAVAFVMTSCKENNKPIDLDVEDGVYVYGEATGFDKVDALLLMANGINEAKDQTVRDGMFEKYIVLQGGKEFSLLWLNAGEQTYYGANLTEFVPEATTGIYEDNPATAIFKGKLEIGESAPKMKVAKTGLYHIVLDLNKNNDLAEAQILVAPANFGVRGGMNGWGFTEMAVTAASNDGMTFSINNAELVNGLEFKFAYGSAWKITLDSEGSVKANTNLGQDGKPGGDNFKVETPGEYNISLTFKLASGALQNSFTYKIDLAKEIEITAPEHMYMIGQQWGSWGWENEGVVELSGIPSAPGYFWCTRYFNAADGFKFCALKEWSGDFTGDGTVGYTTHDGNCWVAEDGFYTVFVNGNDKVVEVYPAEVYGIGTAWGADAWDFNAPDIVKFQPLGQTLVATVTNTDAAVRLSSKIVPSSPIDGLCTPNGWIDWWKTEFVYFDGKIAYRGAGNDQERVPVTAGQVITLDFNAGTVTVGDGGPQVDLWEPINESHSLRYFMYMNIAEDWSNAKYDNVETTECPLLVADGASYTFTLPDQTYSRWQNQIFFHPYDESHFIALNPAKKYHFAFSVTSTETFKGFFKLEKFNAAGGPKYEGEVIWEPAKIDGPDPSNLNIVAGETLTMEYDFTGVEASNIVLVFDFGTNPAGAVVTVKDITLIEK